MAQAAIVGAYHMARWILRLVNGAVSAVVSVALLVAGAYAGYALWDNQQIYAAADNVQADMIKLKPKLTSVLGLEEEEEEGLSFEELLAINPDVCAWITMDNTKIDHPVVQGETNLSYLNTDVYGNFALAGSIFLDSSNDNLFINRYSLLHGHHMANHGMFGDLDLYKDEEFFDENRTGMLMLPDKVFKLETIAYLLVDSADEEIYWVLKWEYYNIDRLIQYVEENAILLNEDTLQGMRDREELTGEEPQLLALSTCSSDFTAARTVVLTVMTEYEPEN